MNIAKVVNEIKNGRHRDKFGARCHYFMVNDKIGIKMFRHCTVSYYEKCLNKHIYVLKNYRAAPQIYGSLTINGFPCLIVEHCKLLKDFTNNSEYWLRKCAITTLLNTLKREYKDIIDCAEDDHDGNVGINQQGHPVLIDFS